MLVFMMMERWVLMPETGCRAVWVCWCLVTNALMCTDLILSFHTLVLGLTCCNFPHFSGTVTRSHLFLHSPPLSMQLHLTTFTVYSEHKVHTHTHTPCRLSAYSPTAWHKFKFLFNVEGSSKDINFHGEIKQFSVASLFLLYSWGMCCMHVRKFQPVYHALPSAVRQSFWCLPAFV